MRAVRPRLVMMNGIAGAGKSTLAQGLAGALKRSGAAVDLLPEEAIFTRPEFAAVGHGFKTRAWPTGPMMLAAYERVIAAARERQSWIIADWDCVGMIEDLPWAQPDRTTLTTLLPETRADRAVLVDHARAVYSLAADLRPILLALELPARMAVERAASERGQPWIARYAAHTAPLGPDEPPIERIIRHVEAGMPRVHEIRRAYAVAGWEISTLDAAAPASAVLAHVLALLTGKPNDF